jgi:hypothetical protein
MMTVNSGRLAGIGRRAAFAVAALILPLAFASPALAEEHHPTGDYAPYADCPLSNPEIAANLEAAACVYAQTDGGEFTVGARTVPLENPITLQGGTLENEEGEATFYAAEDGETISKTPEYVPGGLFNLKPPEWWSEEAKKKYEEMINKGLTGVTETTELAGPASNIGFNKFNLIFEEGTALELPVKVKLDNFLFGKECYIGSDSNPIILHLTTGTTSPPEPNEPISGAKGELEFLDAFTIISLTGGSLVDNAFGAPGASGCGGALSEYIDPFVDKQLGLPSPAGYNAAILNGNLSEAYAPAVVASEP